MGLSHTKLHHRVNQENWAAVCRRLQTNEGKKWVREGNPNGDLALHLACYGGHAPVFVIRALVAAYPESVDMENAFGFTPYDLAAINYWEGHPFRREVLDYLRAYQQDLGVGGGGGDYGSNTSTQQQTTHISSAPSTERDNNESSNDNSSNDNNNIGSVDSTFVTSSTCVICLDAAADHVIAPCGHMCLCRDCAGMVKNASNGRKCCPVCRSEFQSINKVFVTLTSNDEVEKPQQ